MKRETATFDLNNVEPFPWDEAAANIDKETLAELFRELYEANEHWPLGERESALAALRALTKFARESKKDWRGRFSRPLAILELELRNSPKPMPGNILATSRRQAPGRARRDALNYLVAASAFAVDCLGTPVDSALRKVADVLREHRFPPEEFASGPGIRITSVKRAKVERLKGKLKEWRKNCKDGSSKAAAQFERFKSQQSCDARSALDWLQGQLEIAGFESERWRDNR